MALLALDQARVEAGRLDVAPCARLPAVLSLARKAPVMNGDGVADEPASGYQSLADRGISGGDEPSFRTGAHGAVFRSRAPVRQNI